MTVNRLAKSFLTKASLYISYPFTSVTTKLVNAYIEDLWKHISGTPITTITSVFVNSNTVLCNDFVKALLNTLTVNKYISNDCEVTLQVNLLSSLQIKTCQFGLIQDSGVNRICTRPVNILDQHKISAYSTCIKRLCTCFPRVAVDILFDTNNFQLYDHIAKLKSYGVEHITIHELGGIDQEECNFGIYTAVKTQLRENGFTQYELCNFAKSTSARCQHNLSLWSGYQFIGIGPGAHGRLCFNDIDPFARCETVGLSDKRNWVDALLQDRPATKRTKLSKRDVLEELLLLGLSAVSGVNNTTWMLACGNSLQETFKESKDVQLLIENGILRFNCNYMFIAEENLTLQTTVLRRLFTALENKV